MTKKKNKLRLVLQIVFLCIPSVLFVAFFVGVLAVILFPIDLPPPPIVVPEFCWREIEEYSPNSCNLGGLSYILPYEDKTDVENAYDFIERFRYIDAKFAHYGQEYVFKDHICRSIIPITYSSEIYEEAKQYALENFILSEENHFSYNGYVFIENITFFAMKPDESNEHFDYPDEKRENKKFPQAFNMFAYNDEKNTLIFLWIHYDNLQELTEENFDEFLKEYFYIYDFDA